MKKITAFFMAILPFFVTILLFVTGLIVKEVGPHINVEKVIIEEYESLEVKKESDTEPVVKQLKAHVLPVTATIQDVVWKTQDNDIVEVNNEGVVTCKDFGVTKIYACAKENENIATPLDVEVYDSKIHSIQISDQEKENFSYLGINQRRKINYTTKPATRIENPTVIFEPADAASSEIVDIAKDGMVMPKKLGTAHINLYPEANPTKVTQLEVQVKEGVDVVDVKDQSTAISTSANYNVFNDIIVAPEKKENVKPTDFTYTSSDEEIASINENGEATFYLPGEAKFEATYKRNPSLKTTKSVYSSCTFIKDIHFNSDSYVQELTFKDGKYEPTEITNLKCSVFPESTSWGDKFTIESSDKSIVSCEKDREQYKFVAHKPGSVYLTAQAATGESFSSFKRDACLVTVVGKPDGETTDIGLIKVKKVTLGAGMFYMPLYNALNIPSNGQYPAKITFELGEMGQPQNAEIDDNGILHFTKIDDGNDSQYVSIEVYADGTLVGDFEVTCLRGNKALDVNEQTQSLTIKAGQRYKFNSNANPVFDSQYSYSDNFDYSTDSEGNIDFSAKCGQNIQDFYVKLSNGTTKSIKLIVTEDPVYISSDGKAFHSTTEVEVDYLNTSNCAIVPATSMKEDGTTYTLTHSYDFEQDDVGVVEDNIIKFKKPGLVQITTQIKDWNDLTLRTTIKSTYGSMSKFEVLKEDSTPLISNTTIDLLPGGKTATFTITNLTESEASQIKIDQISDTAICNLDKQVIRHGGLLMPWYEVVFTITTKDDVYGNEVISFHNKTYAIYLNVHVTTEIHGFVLTHNRQALKPAGDGTVTNLSYIDSMNLRIMVNPIAIENPQYKVYLDDSADPLTVTDNTISLSNLERGKVHKITFKWTNSKGEDKSQLYQIDVTNDYSNFSVEILDAEVTPEGKQLYLTYNQVQKTFYLRANGLISEDFFKKASEFKVEFDRAGVETTEFLQDTLTISNIPSPEKESDYSHTMTLKYADKVIETYKLTRDIVSQVKFPGHDGSDTSDKKGMQKVHVYGNKSFDDKNQIIDYYTLPVEMYDYKHEIIEDAELKEKAFKTLSYKISNPNVFYEYKDGSIHIKFSNDSLYSVKEMYDNAFDAKQNKNITFTAENKTKTSTASYTFVAVEGYNLNNQDQLKAIYKQGGITQIGILQNDFGTSTGAKFDDPIFKQDDKFEFGGIYGNGHTIMFADIFASAPLDDSRTLWFEFAFNTTIAGFKDQDCKWEGDKSKSVNFSTDERTLNLDQHLFRYVNFKNTKTGISMDDAKHDIYLTNCLFSNGLNGVITNNGNNCVASTYIENCSFFNSGCFAIWPGVKDPKSVCKVYFKGRIDVYNFHNSEMFAHFWGVDASKYGWPIASSLAWEKKMAQIGADGRTYINSFMISFLNDNINFWDGTKYVPAQKGTEATGEYLAKYCDLKLPLSKNIEFELWGTKNPDVISGAPNYYQEYNSDGTLNQDFLNDLIQKLTRVPTYF